VDKSRTRETTLGEEVERYYSDQLRRYGATPLGVGWTCAPTQDLRFVQLARLFDGARGFSLNDVGCGYGALLGYLRKRHKGIRLDYLGLDLSQAMVDAAKRKWRKVPGAAFALAGNSYRMADYCVASGIFNVKLNQDRRTWEDFVAGTLVEMYENSRLGMAVNFLREDGALEEVPELYRCRADGWRDFGRQLGAAVEINGDYGMSEFTLLLRRQ
jgi:SAM-dependent methyltransferase